MAFVVPCYDLYEDRCPCEASVEAVHTELGGSIRWALGVPRPHVSCFTCAAYLLTDTGT